MEAMQKKLHDTTKPVAAMDRIHDMLAQLTLMDKAFADEASDGLPHIQQDGGNWKLTCTPPLVLDNYLSVCYTVPRAENPMTAEDCGTGTEPVIYRVSPNGVSGIVTVRRCLPKASYEALNPDSPQTAQIKNGSGPMFLRVDPPVYKTRDVAALSLNKANLYSEQTLNSIVTAAPASEQRAADTWKGVAASNLPAGRIATAAAEVAGGPQVLPFVNDKGEWECSNNEGGKYKYNTRFGTCTAKTYRPCESKAEGVTVKLEGTSDETCVPTASFLALSDERRSLLCGKTPTGVKPEDAKCVAPKELPEIAATDDSAQTAVLGDVERLGGEATDTATDADADTGAPIQEAGGTCEWSDIPNCAANPSKDKNLRRDFRRSHDENPAFVEQNFSICVFAGNFSKYKDNKAQSGQCLPPRAMGTKLKCTSSREVLCNPVVFGVKGGGAICVPASGDSTKTCAASVADPFEPANGLAGNVWDSFAAEFEANFKKYCIPGKAEDGFATKFQMYFCNECNMIGKTIVDAQADFARKLNLCEAAVGSDPAAPATAQPADDGAGAAQSEKIYD
jgi:hypothetical protein